MDATILSIRYIIYLYIYIYIIYYIMPVTTGHFSVNGSLNVQGNITTTSDIYASEIYIENDPLTAKFNDILDRLGLIEPQIENNTSSISSNFEELRNAFDDCKTLINGTSDLLTGSNENNTSNFNSISSRISEITDTTIPNLQTLIEQRTSINSNTVLELQNELSQISVTKLPELQTSLNELTEQQTTDNNNRISEIQAVGNNITENTAKITENTAKINDINAKLASDEGTIRTLQTTATTLTTKLTTAESNINTLQSTSTALNNKVATSETNFNSLQSTVTNYGISGTSSLTFNKSTCFKNILINRQTSTYIYNPFTFSPSQINVSSSTGTDLTNNSNNIYQWYIIKSTCDESTLIFPDAQTSLCGLPITLINSVSNITTPLTIITKTSQTNCFLINPETTFSSFVLEYTWNKITFVCAPNYNTQPVSYVWNEVSYQ